MSLIDARFVARMLLNARSERLARSMIGHSIERVSEPVTVEVARAYAAATGDDGARYAADGDPVPPLVISRLVLPLFGDLITHRRLGANLLRMVHGEQRFLWHAPLRIGDRVRLRVSIEAIEDTSAGELLRLAGRAYEEATGALRGEATSGMLFRRRRRGPPRGTRSPALQPRDAPPTPSEPLLRCELPTTADQARRYAAASGDDNLIHTRPLVARAAGLPGVILQGLCVLAITTAALTRELLGDELQRLAGVQGRFAAPARPGEPLRLIARGSSDPARVAFEVLDPRGKTVIRDGSLRHR